MQYGKGKLKMAADAIPLAPLELPSSSAYASLTNTPELLSDVYDAFNVLGLTLNVSRERLHPHKVQTIEYGTGSWLAGGDRDYPTEHIYYSPGAHLTVQGIGTGGIASRSTLVRLESNLEKISKLEENWDGEGADKPSEKTIDSARSLINLALQVASTSGEAKYFFEPTQSAILFQTNLASSPGIVASGHKYDNRSTGLLTFDKSLMTTSLSFTEEDKFAQLMPSLYPTVDGGVTLKLFFGGKELKCTAMGGTIEIIRWQSAETYESDGLWDLNIEQTREHLEWLMKPSK